MHTIFPPRPWRTIWAAPACAEKKTPRRFTSMTVSQSASVTSSDGFLTFRPALHTTMSTDPSRSTVVWTAAPMVDGSRTSRCTPIARGRREVSTSSSLARAARSARATAAPCSARAEAIAWPSPPAPPVTKATLPPRRSLSIAPFVAPAEGCLLRPWRARVRARARPG